MMPIRAAMISRNIFLRMVIALPPVPATNGPIRSGQDVHEPCEPPKRGRACFEIFPSTSSPSDLKGALTILGLAAALGCGGGMNLGGDGGKGAGGTTATGGATAAG